MSGHRHGGGGRRHGGGRDRHGRLRGAVRRTARYAARSASVLAFAGYVGRELVVATLAATWTVVAPRRRLSPGVVEVPLACRTDRQVAVLTGLLGLVPGSMPVAVRRDPPTVWVHGLHAGDRDALRRWTRDFEDRMLRVLDGGGDRR